MIKKFLPKKQSNISYAIRFNGVDEILKGEASTTANFGYDATQDYTVEMVVRPISDTPGNFFNGIFGSYNYYDNGVFRTNPDPSSPTNGQEESIGLLLQMTKDIPQYRIRATVAYQAFRVSDLVTSQFLNYGDIHHIVFTVRQLGGVGFPPEVALYIDGVQVAISTAAGPQSNQSATGNSSGTDEYIPTFGFHNGQYGNADIFRWRFFRGQAATQTEVTEMYAKDSVPSTMSGSLLAELDFAKRPSVSGSGAMTYSNNGFDFELQNYTLDQLGYKNTAPHIPKSDLTTSFFHHTNTSDPVVKHVGY